MRWLITGGCGFIGVNLVKNLLKEGGHSIRIIDNFCVGTRKDLTNVCLFFEHEPDTFEPQASVFNTQSSSVELIPADILEDLLSIKLTQGADVIVHLAASTGVGPSVEDPRSDCLTNIIGTLNYLEAARINKVKRFIFASSGASIGECEPPIHEELSAHPVSPYGASKLAGEAYCSAYFRSYGVETVALRFGNVYGPLSSHKNSVVAKFVKNGLLGETLSIYGNGHQTRDFIYIDDLVSAIRKAVKTPGIGGEIFQIATNQETTISDLAEKLLHVFSNYGLDNINVQHMAARSGDVQRNYSDTTKAQKILSWKVRVELTEGLKKTVDWFLADHK